ncbi:MAG: hypothetical protein ACPGJV_15070 [Bacteriovoracaceae bacterium]
MENDQNKLDPGAFESLEYKFLTKEKIKYHLILSLVVGTFFLFIEIGRTAFGSFQMSLRSTLGCYLSGLVLSLLIFGLVEIYTGEKKILSALVIILAISMMILGLTDTVKFF